MASTVGEVPSKDKLETAFFSNDDGVGACWLEGDRILVEKTFKESEVPGIINKIQNKPYILHFRYTTHGQNTVENLHPFKITNNLYMAHNGIIDIKIEDKNKSDTWHYAKYLQSFLNAGNVPNYLDYISTDIGHYNKIAFLNNHGKIFIANEKEGFWEGGIWYSNNSAHTSRYYLYSSFSFQECYLCSSRIDISKYEAVSGSGINCEYVDLCKRCYNTYFDNKQLILYRDLWSKCDNCGVYSMIPEPSIIDNTIFNICFRCESYLKEDSTSNEMFTKHHQCDGCGSYFTKLKDVEYYGMKLSLCTECEEEDEDDIVSWVLGVSDEDKEEERLLHWSAV